jgi:hypothetical protein
MRKMATVLWVSAALLAALWTFIFVTKTVCHECLTIPMAVVCERRDNPVDVQMESNRSSAGGYIKERQYAGCVFYWHESTAGGD